MSSSEDYASAISSEDSPNAISIPSTPKLSPVMSSYENYVPTTPPSVMSSSEDSPSRPPSPPPSILPSSLAILPSSETSSPPPSPPPSRPRKVSILPSPETVANRERYKPLYEACVKGDWDSVKRFVEDNPDPNLWKTRIDTSGNPALCVAALSGQTELISNLVNELMHEEALLATNRDHYTALHYIAKNGDVEAAKILVTKNPLLTQIPNYSQETPLLLAARLGCKEMVRYLVTVTKDEASDRWPSPFRGEQGAALIVSVINFDLYDVALDLVEKYEGITTATNSEGRALISTLARKSSLMSGDSTAENDEGMSAISSLAKKSWPDSAMIRGSTISCTKQRKQYLKLIECICCKCHQYSLLLQNAIKYKQKEIFHYLKDPKFKNELSTLKISDKGDTILHLAANISPSHVLNKIPSAALQLQHDVKWYKEVAAMVPFYENTRNCEGWTPEDIFYKEHRALIKEEGKWIQNIASSSMVVATLIAAVVFAAAFTVPGGTRSDMGLPFFLNKRSYLVFAVSNAMSLFFSLTSVLIFLSILTSAKSMKDLVFRRLIIGEAMLFFAIATMTMAFSATYFIMLGHKLAWLSILIAFFISLPVILFMILQADLFHIFMNMSSL